MSPGSVVICKIGVAPIIAASRCRRASSWAASSGDGRADLHGHPLVPAIPDLAALPSQGRHQVEPAVPVQHAEEPQDHAFDLISEDLLQNSVFLGRRHLRRGQNLTEVGMLRRAPRR